MAEENEVIIVGMGNVGNAMSDRIVADIDKDGNLFDFKRVSSGTSISDLVMMKNNETEQLINELIRTANERIATNSLDRPMSGQESRRERRKQQRNVWK